MFIYVFLFFNVFCVFIIALLFAFCFENIHAQNYKYDAIDFGKLRWALFGCNLVLFK